MKASEIMTTDIVSVTPGASVLEAARLMLQKNISGLPVINATGGLVGIITEGDFLRRKEIGTQRHRSRWIEFFVGPGKLAEEYVHSSGRKVEEVMTASVHSVLEDASIEEIVELMERRHIKRVPVMRGRRVVGIITRANILRAAMRLAHEVEPISKDDKGIRDTLLAELKKQPWAPIALIDVKVKDGVVSFTGAVTAEHHREALRVAAENIAGVRKVVDDMVWVEPLSGTVLAN